MNRRTFLRSSATAATLALTPTFAPKYAEAALPKIPWNDIWRWVGKLVIAVAPTALEYVLDWVKGDDAAQQTGSQAVSVCQNQNYTVYDDVYVNNNLYSFGTSDTAYTNGEMLFIYPLSTGSYNWTRLGSLAIYGLTQAADTFTQWYGYDASTLNNLLLPYAGCSCSGNAMFTPQTNWYITYYNGIGGFTTVQNQVVSCKCVAGRAKISVSACNSNRQYMGSGIYQYTF